jgi:cyclic beta-1,2-glucan synthetase
VRGDPRTVSQAGRGAAAAAPGGSGGLGDRHLRQVVFEFACLPYEAFYSLDAIVRTHWRMLVTHRRLLEWNPSIDAERAAARQGRSEFAAALRAMWVAPTLASAAALHLALSTPAMLLVAAPVLLLWFASPLFAWWISRPLARREAVLSGAQILFLRALSRRTWAFFDTFVGPEDHWLPPDNYQKYRVAAVAHRTSPTNIGMALLANLSAYDFGYLSTGQLVERTANTLRTMHGLQRHRGHFYNWYDTQTLQPLPPLYISTVDSGNLAGHLLTLRAGLLALADDRILMTRLFDGLGDTLRILTMAAEAGATAPMAAFRKELETASAAPPATLTAARSQLARLASAADAIASVSLCPDCGQPGGPAGDCAGGRNTGLGTGAGRAMSGRRRGTERAGAVAGAAAAAARAGSAVGPGRRARRPRCRPDPARAGASGCRAAAVPRRAVR